MVLLDKLSLSQLVQFCSKRAIFDFFLDPIRRKLQLDYFYRERIVTKYSSHKHNTGSTNIQQELRFLVLLKVNSAFVVSRLGCFLMSPFINIHQPQILALVADHETVVVIVAVVLQKLAQLTEVFVAMWAIVRKIRNPTAVMVTIREHRPVGHKVPHVALSAGKLENLLPGVIASPAAPTVAALDVLDGVCTRTEAGFPADWTRNSAGPVDLRVHIQLVLVIEPSIAHTALKDGSGLMVVVHARPATTVPVALRPLVPAELAAASPVVALGTVSTHLCYLIVCALYYNG